ncbi:unnamed protein product [Clonostachys byssicola]|uniref:FMN hydroxy acid dehydrogenase domain-containing protein n=1 Tax=Clonostachys byssicola TaxID=160290 RepID=A0A9N9YBT8_9HYPO|nr:unnamed protein product [Clonostachys byssicola]
MSASKEPSRLRFARTSAEDSDILTIKDLAAIGAKRVPQIYNEYFSGGAGEEATSVRDNVDAFARYKLRPRVLKDVGDVDLTWSLFDIKTAGPLGFSPSAAHKLAHPDGEVATSRAAAANGVPMALSCYSSTSLEDVIAQGTGNPYIMQMTLFKDLSVSEMIIKRAEAAGYKALFVSVDLPILGTRLQEHRSKFEFPPHVTFPNLQDPKGEREVTLDDLDYNPRITWEKEIAWLRARTKMQIWLKGIYTSDDVELAIRYNLDGVIISNHGGRQLDGVPSTLDALRECAAVGGGRIPIGFDGGIRHGSDIFKAIALGADFCFLGRVCVWGLAVRDIQSQQFPFCASRRFANLDFTQYKGEEGVDFAVKLLLKELKQTMMLCGCRTIKDIKASHLSVLLPSGVLSRL